MIGALVFWRAQRTNALRLTTEASSGAAPRDKDLLTIRRNLDVSPAKFIHGFIRCVTQEQRPPHGVTERITMLGSA